MSPTFPEFSDSLPYFDETGLPALDGNGVSIAPYMGAVGVDDGSALLCQGITLTVGGTVYPVSAFSLELNWSVEGINSVQAESTRCKVIRTRPDDSNVSGNLALEYCDGGAALDDVLTKAESGEAAALQIILANATEKLTIDVPVIQLTDPQERVSGGTRAFDVGFQASGDGSVPVWPRHDVVFTFESAV